MNQEDIKKKLDEAKDSAQNALSGIKVHLKDMDKEKAKDALSGAKEKAKVALAEITANFKADEGAEGVKKYQSMFKNLWKSGTTGKATLVAASFVVLLLFKSIFLGGGTSDVGEGFEDSTSEDVDTLVMKGLYMRQPGDEAMKACKKIVSSSKDLVAIDFRKGIEREKDEATKANEKKRWDDRVKEAEKDVDLFLTWLDRHGCPFDVKKESYVGEQELLSLEFEGGVNAAITWPKTAAHASMISLAKLYGYQVEWMLPATRMPSPLVVGSFELTKESAERHRQSIEEYWSLEIRKGKNLDEVTGPICSKKGMQFVWPNRSSSNTAWFRLTLKTRDGKVVTKKSLVDGVIAFKPKFTPVKGTGSLNEREVAEKYVDTLLQWVELYGEHSMILHKSAPVDNQGERIDAVIGARIGRRNVDVENLMAYLAQRFHLIVEWGVMARSKEPIELKKTFSVSKKDNEEEKVSDVHGSARSEIFKKEHLFDVGSSAWFRLVLKNTNGVEVAKEEVVKSWLAARGYRPPSDKEIIAKKNLIEIAIREDGKREDQLKGLCFVWIDGEDKVKEVYFNEKGMARIFNAGDLSSDEFAEALVKNYQGDIPSLTTDVRTEAATDDLLASMKTRTWIYKDPRGYQVKLLERDFYDVVGQKVNLRADLALALAVKADKTRDKFFTVFAIKPESERKFD